MAGRGSRAIPVSGVSELVLEVHDLAIAEGFYAGTLGWPVLRGADLAADEQRFDGHGRAAFVTDPDGNVVEFWTWDVAGHLAAD